MPSQASEAPPMGSSVASAEAPPVGSSVASAEAPEGASPQPLTDGAGAPSEPLTAAPTTTSQDQTSVAGAEAPSDHRPASYTFFAILSFIAAAADLVTKELATRNLTGKNRPANIDGTYVVISSLFGFRHAKNEGGAWSALTSLPEIWRRPFFLFVSTAASVFIVSVYARVDSRDTCMKWGLPLALGGAVGNLVDRVRHGYVVDFLYPFTEKKRDLREAWWPTFNVADVWIVAGVALMAISLLFGYSRKQLYKDDG